MLDLSSCRMVSSLVVMYSFLCSNAIPPHCLAVLFTMSILWLLLCRSIVSIHALSSSVFFQQSFCEDNVSQYFLVCWFHQSVVVYSLLILHLLLLFLYCLGYFYWFHLFVPGF